MKRLSPGFRLWLMLSESPPPMPVTLTLDGGVKVTFMPKGVVSDGLREAIA